MARQLHGLKHWQCTLDHEGIVWAVIDQAGASMNTLGRETAAEAEKIIGFTETAAKRGEARGLIFMSGKDTSFIAGADIAEFDGITDAYEVEAEIRKMTAALDRLERFPIPVIAAIHGYCLGGGLELAMACHCRIATQDEATQLGLPEVKLGIFPGLNGTVRIIRLAGAAAGMQAMLTGRFIRPEAARAMGIVDELVLGQPELRWAARRAVLGKRRARGASWLKRRMSHWPLRGLLAKQMRKAASAKVREAHYPAPFQLIELFRRYGGDPNRMAVEESRVFVSLLVSEQSRNLRRVFRLMEMLKSEAPKDNSRPSRIHVVGAGTMGSDIAAVSVLAGMEVSLEDQNEVQLQKAREKAAALFKKRLKSQREIEAAMGRLHLGAKGKLTSRADIVIEAIVENLEAKQRLFAALEPRLKPGTVVATNTSSLPIEDIAKALRDPGRLIGLHFFNPVPLMPLVEVVRGAGSREADIRRGCGFVTALGKCPLIVKSGPGFLVNRVLAPYMFAAMKLYEEGVEPEKIDAAAEHFGMIMGPVEVADNVGLDVIAHAAEILGFAKDQGPKAAQLITAGKFGKKTGEGFYKWVESKPVKRKRHYDPNELEKLTHVLIEPLINECEKCLAEGVVESADHVDAGVILGTGFAPFRGGPLHYRYAGKEPAFSAVQAPAAE